mgnify:CR=1 FL=1
MRVEFIGGFADGQMMEVPEPPPSVLRLPKPKRLTDWCHVSKPTRPLWRQHEEYHYIHDRGCYARQDTKQWAEYEQRCQSFTMKVAEEMRLEEPTP